MKKFANDLIKTVELPYDSDEYKRIFYSLNLNLCLPSAEINIKSLASIPINFSVNNKNENENALTLESWVNQDGFREENSIESVINDGSFHINQDNPMKFLIGKLTENNKMLEENMEYTFILCKINPGRPFVVSKSKIDKFGDQPLIRPTEGYNSLFVDREETSIPFPYTYYIFDDFRVKPTHVVKFSFKLNPDENENLIECEDCQDQTAVIYCKNDQCYLCEDCDQKIHYDNADAFKSSILAKHERVKISDKDKTYGKCPIHPDRDLEYYCLTCDKPICVNCKIKGDHSGENMARHSTVDIREAFSDAIREFTSDDVNINKKKHLITTNILKIEDKMKELKNNSKEVEEQIYELIK